jgi:hypothetical protein
MVNFNSDSTVSAPAADIMRILILQRRNDLLEAMESFYKVQDHGAEAEVFVVKARLKTFFWEVQAAIKRNSKEDEYTILETAVLTAQDITTIEDLYKKLNEYLDKLRLIRIDTRSQYDSLRVTQEDEAHGL